MSRDCLVVLTPNPKVLSKQQ